MKFPEQFRWKNAPAGYATNNGDTFGAFEIPARYACGRALKIIACDGSETGWEHVSVTIDASTKCPSWNEMALVKSLFWDDGECVIQFHPPKTEYVNNHPGCLHLWKCTGQEFPLPDSILVGIKATPQTPALNRNSLILSAVRALTGALAAILFTATATAAPLHQIAPIPQRNTYTMKQSIAVKTAMPASPKQGNRNTATEAGRTAFWNALGNSLCHIPQLFGISSLVQAQGTATILPPTFTGTVTFFNFFKSGTTAITPTVTQQKTAK